MKEIRDDSVQLATRIPKRLHRAVKLACIERGESVQAWVVDAVEAHLRRCHAEEAGERSA